MFLRSTLRIFLIIVVSGHYSVLPYNWTWTCPAQSQRHFRKDVCTDPAKPHYVCVLDVSENVNVESCENDFFVARKGQKQIRRPGITNGNCTETRYQPIPFTTDEFSECMYSKSLCSDEGQVIANNGSSGYQDRTCRCDYRAGYTYIVEPRNICECVPSEEDCSCYRKTCPSGKEMSVDYECRDKDAVFLTRCDKIKGEVKEDTSKIQTESRESLNIGDSTSMSYTYSHKAAAGLIILLILLAVLLVVLLFDFRPHVTEMTVNIDKNHIIYRDDNNHVYHVIEGHSMSVDCKIRSRIRVKSVKMVKVSPQMERSNIVVKSVQDKKNQLQEISRIRSESNRLSAIDTGEHRCILTNGLPIPLNNDNTLSWFLARNQVIKYVTDIPSFSLETTNRITLIVHEIPSKDDMEIKEGYSGDNIKFIAALQSKNSIFSVYWVKVVQPSPNLKVKSLPCNNSTTYSIENITLRDSGDYVCFMTTKDATNNLAVYSHGFILNVSPSESSYDKVVQHRDDDTYVQISAVDRAMEKLRKHKIVILKGREGTGKSKMCLEIASRCEDEYQYFPVMLTSKKDVKEEFDNAKVLYILDQSDDIEEDKFKELYKMVLERTVPSNAWTIIACRSLYGTEMGDENLLDCDSVLSTEEKEKVLMLYMTKQNVGIAAADFNYKQKDILINQDIQATLDRNGLDEMKDNFNSALSSEKNDLGTAVLPVKSDLDPVISTKKKENLEPAMNPEENDVNLAPSSDKKEDSVLAPHTEKRKKDYNDAISAGEKAKNLIVNLPKHHAKACNYKQKDILTNQNIQVTLDKDAINEIITTEPLQGFPLMAKNFCKDREKLHLGEKFFTNPPKQMVDRIVELRETAIRENDCESFLMFCILVYLTTKCNRIDMTTIKTWYKDFGQVHALLADTVYKFGNFKRYLNVTLEDSDEKKIHNALNKMIGIYLKETDGVYEFIHPYMSKATFLSSQYFATHGLQNCPIEYILEFIRSCKYNNSEEEIVLKIDKEYLHILCERLVREITIHSEKAKLSHEGMGRELDKQAKVCKYIYDEWVKSKDETFCSKLFSYVDGSFSFIRDYEFTLQAWHMLCLMNHVTCNGMDPWIYSIQDIPDMAVIFGLISACEKRYSLNEQKRATFEILLAVLGSRLIDSKEELKKKSQSYSSVKLTMNDKSALQIDQYGNTLFHYICLYNENEACQIMEKYMQFMNKKCLKECLQLKSKESIQPIHLAVALGKSKFLEKIKSVIDSIIKDNKEGNIVLKQNLQNVKDVHIKRKDNKDLSAFNLNKNFDQEISRSVTQGSKEDFEQVLKLFPSKWLNEDLSKSIKKYTVTR